MKISATLGTRIAIVIAVSMVAGAAYVARGIEPGVTFATYGIDLKIDSKGYYNGQKIPSATWKLKDLNPGSDKFFNFDDIKPGDYGCEVVSLHVKKADAWMCMDFKNFSESENGVNEPESHEDGDGAVGAELADGTEFFGWMDDGDGKYEPPLEKPIFGTSTQSASHVLNNQTYAIADSRGGGSCKMESKRFVGMCWCAGNLTVKPNGQFECDATALGNEAQTDSFSVDIEFRAVPEKQNKKFVCGGYPPVTPPCDKCGGSITITNNNNAVIVNNTNSSANTGGNTAGSGGTVNTGSASSSASTTVITNTNSTGDGGDAENLINRLLNRLRR